MTFIIPGIPAEFSVSCFGILQVEIFQANKIIYLLIKNNLYQTKNHKIESN